MRKIAFIFLFFGVFNFANAKVEIDIDEGVFEPIRVAVADFEGQSLEEINYGKQIRAILSDDLQNSGYFKVIGSQVFLEHPSFSKTPIFANWRVLNANLIVMAHITMLRDINKIRFKYEIWDTYQEKIVESKTYTIDIRGWRRISHKLANSIYKISLGVDGYFDSKIVFVAEKGGELNKIKRIALMDQDGANFRFFSPSSELSLSPRLNADLSKIIYMSFYKKNRTPKVHIIDLHTGKKSLVGDMHGMSFAPRFSPDGDSIIFSLSKHGTTSIYEMNLLSKVKNRLTALANVIDTSPDYSPDGEKIVFNSNRDTSKAQLYMMDRDGSNVKRITFEDGSYRTPSWSPDGKWIAFTKILHGSFYIGVINTKNYTERLLTNSWLEESPSWSPNSKSVLFNRQTMDGRNKLYSIDINGKNEKVFPTPTDASQPFWSRVAP